MCSITKNFTIISLPLEEKMKKIKIKILVLMIAITLWSNALFSDIIVNSKNEKKISVESIGITPFWFSTNLNDINYLMSEFEFKEIDRNSRIMYSADLRISTYNDFFVGLMFAYNQSNQSVLLVDKEPWTSRKLALVSNYLGISIGKKILFTDKLFFSPNFVLGIGSHKLNIASSDNYLALPWDQLGDYFTNSNYDNLTLIKDYLIIQPKFGVDYQIFKALYVNVEAGYIFGVALNDWRLKNMLSTNEIYNAPDTPFRGWTIGIGPKIFF